MTARLQPVGDGIGEEVERVGLERLRPGELARHNLAAEHRPVDADDHPEDALVAGVHPVKDRHARGAAGIPCRAAGSSRYGPHRCSGSTSAGGSQQAVSFLQHLSAIS